MERFATVLGLCFLWVELVFQKCFVSPLLEIILASQGLYLPEYWGEQGPQVEGFLF